MDKTITLTQEEAWELLDYLNAAGHGMSEYGHPSEDFVALERFKAMVHARLDSREYRTYLSEPERLTERQRQAYARLIEVTGDRLRSEAADQRAGRGGAG